MSEVVFDPSRQKALTVRPSSVGGRMRHLAHRVGGVAARGALVLTAVTVIVATPQSAFAQGDIILKAAAAQKRVGQWTVATDTTAISGAVMRQRDRGAAKILKAVASPKNYFEITFQAASNTPYRLWLRGRADGNYWGNDSVFIQFDKSVTSSGAATFRIGTTSATEVNLESCHGCGVSGWIWQDNGYGKGVLGTTIRFASAGTQTMRVQTREDGLVIDQIVLSRSNYLTKAPTTKARAATSAQQGDGTSSASSSSSSSVLKVLDWNIHHGVGTDGDYDIDRLATAIAKAGANVVSLNEVERYTGWGNEDQPARFASLLRSKTGKTWHYKFAQHSGNANGQGNVLLTTYAIESDDDYELSYTRGVARITIVVNGIRVNVFSTHLDPDSSARRTTQMRELKNWADNYPEQRILVGDFNAWPGAPEIANMTSGHSDAWATALRAGDAIAFAGNAAGNTRNSRIDYVFYSKGASRLKLKEARVFDERDSHGVMPSDHRPVMATFDVK